MQDTRFSSIMFVRNAALALLVMSAITPGAVLGQLSTTPGFTRFDQQQFAKLQRLVGTWKCVDVPASKKPDIQTVKRLGNFFVTRESGDVPSTQYTRWSHGYRMYYTVEIQDGGGTQVYVSKDLDPFNGTWTTAFPPRMPAAKPYYGKAIFPFTAVSNGDSITYAGRYYDDKGAVRVSKSTCMKVI